MTGDSRLQGAPAAPWEARPVSRRAANNPWGTASLVLSILALALGWVPVLGWTLWLSAGATSVMGLTRTPRWPAVAGLVISVFIAGLAVTVSVAGSDAVGGFINMLFH